MSSDGWQVHLNNKTVTGWKAILIIFGLVIGIPFLMGFLFCLMILG